MGRLIVRYVIYINKGDRYGLMDFIIDSEQMDSEDFSGASIYLDACFILAYLDKTDHRRYDVARVLDVWSDYEDVVLGMSNHTVAEVINRLFQMRILGALQVYHENNKLLNQTKNGYEKLNAQKKEQLLDLDGARYLYGLAKKSEILKLYNKEVSVKISELIKLAKEDEKNRSKLDVFYNVAVDTFEAFVHCMKEELHFRDVEILDSLAQPHYQIAKSNMRIMQLDIIDSFHLGIAQHNFYDFLATLDSDFVHNFYSKGPASSTRIIKVA